MLHTALSSFFHNLQNGDHVVPRVIFLLTSMQPDFFCDRFCKHFSRPTASLMAASSHAAKTAQEQLKKHDNEPQKHYPIFQTAQFNWTSVGYTRIIPIPGGPTSKPTGSKNSPCQAPQDTPRCPISIHRCVRAVCQEETDPHDIRQVVLMLWIIDAFKDPLEH